MQYTIPNRTEQMMNKFSPSLPGVDDVIKAVVVVVDAVFVGVCICIYISLSVMIGRVGCSH